MMIRLTNEHYTDMLNVLIQSLYQNKQTVEIKCPVCGHQSLCDLADIKEELATKVCKECDNVMAITEDGTTYTIAIDSTVGEKVKQVLMNKGEVQNSVHANVFNELFNTIAELSTELLAELKNENQLDNTDSNDQILPAEQSHAKLIQDICDTQIVPHALCEMLWIAHAKHFMQQGGDGARLNSIKQKALNGLADGIAQMSTEKP